MKHKDREKLEKIANHMWDRWKYAGDVLFYHDAIDVREICDPYLKGDEWANREITTAWETEKAVRR